jgi:hypothetical protein
MAITTHRHHRPPCTPRPSRATIHNPLSMSDSGCQDNTLHDMDNTTTGASSTSRRAVATARADAQGARSRQFFPAVHISTNLGQHVRQSRGRSDGCTDSAKPAMANTNGIGRRQPLQCVGQAAGLVLINRHRRRTSRRPPGCHLCIRQRELIHNQHEGKSAQVVDEEA